MAIFDTGSGHGNELSRIAYITYIEPQWNNSKVLHNYFAAAKKEPTSVLQTKITLQINGNFSGSGMTDNGSTPAVNAALYKQLTIPFSHVANSVGITGQAVDVISGAAAIQPGRDLVATEMQAAADGFLKLLNFLDWGDGTGTLATVSGTGGSHTTETTTGNDLARYIRQGMRLDAYDSTLVTPRFTGAEVLSVSSAGVVTWTSAQAATSSGDVLVLTNALNAAPNGLKYQISNSNTYYGQPRTSFPILQSYVSDEGATELTLPKIYKLLANVKRASGRFNPADALFLLHYDQMQVLHEIGYATQRYMGKIGRFDAGVGAVSFMDIPAEVEDDCHIAEVYLIQKGTLFLTVTEKLPAPNWINGPDGQIWHMTPNTSGDSRGGYKFAYEANMHFYYNVATNAPNRHGKLTNLLIPSGYTTWVS